ncbi:unnamed protein product [Rhizophagus irregularis]|nr:unnamed protein product [Rhizophagus irregularis]
MLHNNHMSSVRLSHRKTLKKKNLIVTIASNQSPPYETNLLQRYGNMNQAVVSTGALPPSTTTQITTPTTNDSKFEYIDALPDNTVHQFKAILVHYIRKRLPKGYRQLGKQTVSIPATESQFYAVFKNYIHYYSATKGIYKCIFRGGSSNQILANILEMEGWETKFYDQRQCTYVVLCDDDNNIEDGDENPITAALTYETIKKLRKPKCVRGQLVVEWKKQKNTDFNGNIMKRDGLTHECKMALRINIIKQTIFLIKRSPCYHGRIGSLHLIESCNLHIQDRVWSYNDDLRFED